jgi:hypothetical protein
VVGQLELAAAILGATALAIGGVDRLAAAKRSSRQALASRLKAFERAKQLRQTAALQRRSHELDMLAYRTAQAMLRASIESTSGATSTPDEHIRCQ